MYAVVTGASSGLGREFAIQLAQIGYHLIIVARRKERLKVLKGQLEKRYGIDVIVMEYDLSDRTNCFELYEDCKEYNVTLLINNAGFGKIGEFRNIPIEEELSMIDTNIGAVHLLTKLFLRKMKSGRILNVASVAGLCPCPTMTTYGATKAYVISFSRALNYELKRQGSGVRVSVLCPGPVNTEFDKVANTNFSLNYISAKKCVGIALNGLFKDKEIIVPSFLIKLLSIGSKHGPMKLILWVEYHIQTRKLKK